MDNLTTKAKIDTLEIITATNNIKVCELEKLKGYGDDNKCISKVRCIEEDRKSIVINPSRLYGRYSDYIGYKEYKERITNILENICYDLELLKLRRLDICIDYMAEFEEQLQLNYSLLECINNQFKNKRKYMQIIDLNDFKTSNIKWSNDRNFIVSVYDKKKESKGKHTYNTRVEYRLKYSNKNYYEDVEINCIEELIEILNKVKKEENYDMAKQRVIKVLEEEAKETNNFTNFMKNRKVYIFDNDIAKELYIQKGKTKTQAKNLISRNKKMFELNMIKYTDYKQYVNKQIQEINKFKDY